MQSPSQDVIIARSKEDVQNFLCEPKKKAWSLQSRFRKLNTSAKLEVMPSRWMAYTGPSMSEDMLKTPTW
jgi:hypothetical protein